MRTQPLRIALAAAMICAIPTFAYAAELSSQTLRYSVLYTVHDAGDLEIVIENDGKTIKTAAISHLSSMAEMFLSGLTVETWFDLLDGEAILDKGHTLNHDEEGIAESFKIDYNQGMILNSNDENIPIEVGDQFDATSFPVALIVGGLDGISGQSIREISPGKARYYVYHTPTRETIEVNGQTHSTWRVSRNKRGEKDRLVTFWLDENTLIPWKIISSSSGKDTVMTRIPAE